MNFSLSTYFFQYFFATMWIETWFCFRIKSEIFNSLFGHKSNLIQLRTDMVATPPPQTFIAVSSMCNSAPGSGPSSPNSSNCAITENGLTGSVPNIHTEVRLMLLPAAICCFVSFLVYLYIFSPLFFALNNNVLTWGRDSGSEGCTHLELPSRCGLSLF